MFKVLAYTYIIPAKYHSESIYPQKLFFNKSLFYQTLSYFLCLFKNTFTNLIGSFSLTNTPSPNSKFVRVVTFIIFLHYRYNINSISKTKYNSKKLISKFEISFVPSYYKYLLGISFTHRVKSFNAIIHQNLVTLCTK